MPNGKNITKNTIPENSITAPGIFEFFFLENLVLLSINTPLNLEFSVSNTRKAIKFQVLIEEQAGLQLSPQTFPADLQKKLQISKYFHHYLFFNNFIFAKDLNLLSFLL